MTIDSRHRVAVPAAFSPWEKVAAKRPDEGMSPFSLWEKVAAKRPDEGMSRHPRRPRAFTLTEILVAVAAVAIVSVGIGSLFKSISDLVSVGSATAEVDQIARAFERQLRDDIDAFNRMRPEDAFLAIRHREVGDVNHDGALGVPENGEVPLYLSKDDFDADQRDILDGLLTGPYAPGSRAVTRRIDDLMFLTFNGDGSYSTFQIDGVNSTTGASSQFARVYYGHGLRPSPDTDWPPLDPEDPTAKRQPTRYYIPDGDFGWGATGSRYIGPRRNPFDAVSGVNNGFVFGANEFASGWSLVRQPLLLKQAREIEQAGAATTLEPPIGAHREYAPFARDIDTMRRATDMEYDSILEDQDLVDVGLVNDDYPDMRLIRHGRVDICAQDAQDLRRFLEGRDADDNSPSSVSGFYNTGRALTGGRLLDFDSSIEDPVLMNAPLWIRRNSGAQPDLHNFNSVQLAIAGMFARPLVDPRPPVIDRVPPSSGPQRVDAEDAMMDIHAIIATRCSNFEVAWSDGATALRDIDFDNDGDFEMGRGDIIWYDMTPLPLPGGGGVTRSTRENWGRVPSSYANINALPDVDDPEIDKDDWGDLLIPAGSLRNDVFVGAPTADGSNPVLYSPILCGGSPFFDTADDARERMAIFPFRSADPAGGFGGAFPKHMLLRIRVTFHDALGRLPEGKTYEYIFDLDPAGF